MSLLSSAEWIALQDEIVAFPVMKAVWLPHCLMMSLALRAAIGDQWKAFSRRHPLATLVANTLYVFPGGIIASVLLTEPILQFTLNSAAMTQMAIAWYAVFFAPFDCVVGIVDALRLRRLLAATQDFMRIYLVLTGVETIHERHPDAFLYPVVFAFCKSSGFMFVKYFESVFLDFPRSSNALIVNHHSSKTCFAAAVAFTSVSLGYVALPMETMYALFCLAAITSRLAFANAVDPYFVAENLTCAVAFGNPPEAEQPEQTDKKLKKS